MSDSPKLTGVLVTPETLALTNHALLTIRELEMRLDKRGCTTGKKKWELKLLASAYNALQTPRQDRKFGLSN